MKKLLPDDDLIKIVFRIRQMDHFTVVCLVAWPFNKSGAGVDLVISMRTVLLA